MAPSPKPSPTKAIQKNAGFILQASGKDDVLIPFDKQMRAASLLGADLHT
jgi:hypothetical protein